MKVEFAEMEQEFIEKAHKAVWSNVATIDTENRPRSRVLHPIWEGAIGWIATGRHSLKNKHIEHNPYVSLAYVADPFKPVYVEAKAEWVDDMTEKERIWKLFGQTPPPLGYDLAMFFKSLDNPEYGVLKLIPWQITLGNLMGEDSVCRF